MTYDKVITINDIYDKLKNPVDSWLYEYEKEGGEGKCLDSEYFQAETAAWKDGYKILEYYEVLRFEMIPTIENAFWDVESTITKIAETNSIQQNDEGLQSFDSYKDIMNHLTENYTVTRIEHEYSTSLVKNLTDSCLKTVSKNDSNVISDYNNKQSTLNSNAFTKAINAKNSKDEPERFIIKEDEKKFRDIVYAAYPYGYRQESTPVTMPTTSSPTQPFDTAKWYNDYYSHNN